MDLHQALILRARIKSSQLGPDRMNQESAYHVGEVHNGPMRSEPAYFATIKHLLDH
jgi:hypothetical protein